VTSDQQSAALEGLLARVQTIVADTGVGAHDDELLAAFRELRSPDDRRGATSEVRARIIALPGVVAERLPHPVASRVPGGTILHRAIARATRRHDEALLEEIRGLASQIKDRLLELTDAAPSSLTDSVEQATSQIQTVADTVATIEERLAAMLSRIEALEARLDRPERSS
jgi:hypothetical protein